MQIEAKNDGGVYIVRQLSDDLNLEDQRETFSYQGFSFKTERLPKNGLKAEDL